MSAQELITDHLDLWTGAVTQKRGSGRGSNGKVELTGTKKLRELILELAVRGMLVEQDPDDEPASVLLESIADEKARLVREGKIRRAKSQPAVELEEADFGLPSSWLWVRLGSVGQIVGGGTPKSGEPSYWAKKGVSWLTPADLYELNEKYIASGKRDISSLGLEKSSAQLLPEGAVLFSSRAPIGYVAIAAKELATNQGFKSCAPYIREFSQFVYYFLKRSAKRIDASASGTTFKEVSGSKVASIPMPLPPLEEQLRIVEKIDELMALCDRLEQQVGDQLEAHEVLVDTLLDALARSADATEVAENWARIAEHFDTLFTTEASIDKLKQTILQLAVTGRLTGQNQEDVPASFAYEKKISLPENYNRKTKQKIKERPITSLKELPAIPPSWAYFKIDELYNSNHILDYADGNHGSLYPRKGEFGGEGVLFLTAAQITDDGEIMWGNCPRLSYGKANKLSKGWSQIGDVLFTHNATVGRTGLASSPPENDFLLGTSVTFYRVNGESVDRDYLHYYFASPLWQNQAAAIMKQTTRNQVSITKQALFYVSLPPLNEQRRIVKRVHATMSLCDQLKARLGEAGETKVNLAETVVDASLS